MYMDKFMFSDWLKISYIFQDIKCIVGLLLTGVMVNDPASKSGQTKVYEIGSCCYSAKHVALRKKSKG